MTDVVLIVEPQVVTVEVTQSGLPGPPGPPDIDSLKVYNRLSEFGTPEARTAARANLELQDIDCGEFL